MIKITKVKFQDKSCKPPGITDCVNLIKFVSGRNEAAMVDQAWRNVYEWYGGADIYLNVLGVKRTTQEFLRLYASF